MRRIGVALLLVACSSSPVPNPGVERPTIQSESCPTTPELESFTIDTASSGVVSVCNFYDPEQVGIPSVDDGVPIKIIHVAILSGASCGPCNDELDHIDGTNTSGTNPPPAAAWAQELAPFGVVFMVMRVDSLALQTLTNQPNVFIGDPANPATVFDGAAMLNVDIDARTLDILATDDGFSSDMDQQIKQLL
jgi:hypothetical protein